MKTAHDPRHRKRVEMMQNLFAYSFKTPRGNSVIRDILAHQKKIDELITRSAPAWPLTKIAKIDLAILRLSIYELVVKEQTPPKVVIDEAVELAKAYGGDGSAAFINGVLGTIYSWLQQNAKP